MFSIKSLLGGPGVIKAHTLLVAQKKVLRPEGVQLLGEGTSLYDLALLRPELWIANGQPRRVVKDKVVTTAFVNFIVDQLQAETSAFGDFKYHDSGTGTDAEAIGDTTLDTAWGGDRSTGTQTEGASANIYKSVATTTYNASKAITEHGLFNIDADGILMDRTKFDAINVVDTNQIEFTFEITFTAGG
jgi:hypothetical protein